jgi:hypothetical protein
VEFVDVLSNPDKLNAMLKVSDGARRVPIIVEQDTVTIGYNGKT